MNEMPGDLQYTKEHEWLRREDDGSVTVGITDHAQSALGDLVYVELPESGQDLEFEGEMAVNEELADDPEKINSDPYGDGWIVKIQPAGDIDESTLMSPDDYQTLIDELDD